MHPGKRSHTMPNWLDGKTIAMLTTMLTVALTLGTMLQTAHSSLRNDIQNLRTGTSGDLQNLRTELSSDIQNLRTDLGKDINRLDDRVGKLDDRLRSVEVGVATIQTTMTAFDSRLRRVEERHVRHADETPAAAGSDG